jgi:hypothetical protein
MATMFILYLAQFHLQKNWAGENLLEILSFTCLSPYAHRVPYPTLQDSTHSHSGTSLVSDLLHNIFYEENTYIRGF